MINVTPEIIQEISKELGIPVYQVEKAVNAQFKFVAHCMADDTFSDIRLQYLGKFVVLQSKLEKIKEWESRGNKVKHRKPEGAKKPIKK